MNIRTRFAPSPTGYLHIGGARTALFNWLYAKKHQGEFLLRIEDTDQKRSTDEFTQDILKSLSWLGIDSDIEPIYQSKRSARYQEIIQQLLDEKNAYHCYCTKERIEALREEQMKKKQKPRYDGFCRDLAHPPSAKINPVVRFKNPLEGEVVIEDQIRGKVVINNSELDDLVLARSDGSATYHLCVIVDDIDLAITHAIRGDDHLNNTPRQINIIRALKQKAPTYAHIPLIHGKDGKRLSKRHGAVSTNQYRSEGILPDALLNYLVRLGWSHGDQEIFSIQEMIKLFDLESVHKSAATFDNEKLLWVNQQHMKKTAGSSIEAMLGSYFKSKELHPDNNPTVATLYDVQKERCKTLQEICDTSRYFYNDIDTYDEKTAKKNFTQDSVKVLRALKVKLTDLDSWSAECIHMVIKAVADDLDLKLGKVAPALRLAVTGQGVSPPIDVTLELLGSDKSLYRIDQAIDYVVGSV